MRFIYRFLGPLRDPDDNPMIRGRRPWSARFGPARFEGLKRLPNEEMVAVAEELAHHNYRGAIRHALYNANQKHIQHPVRAFVWNLAMRV